MVATKYHVQMDELMPLFREQLVAGRTVKFSPRGFSMLPMLRQGIDSVVLSPITDSLKKYDLILYRKDDGRYILHRIVELGETYTCCGDNLFEYDPGIRQDQMIAVVTAFTRGEKLHTVTEPGYWLYCRIWYHSRGIRRLWGKCADWLNNHIFSK